jgi:hypothetical protein
MEQIVVTAYRMTGRRVQKVEMFLFGQMNRGTEIYPGEMKLEVK